ncbi:hypothetical protein [Nostoc sp. UHCC 0302]|uniref:hypothetical protein n=1 Tax=Nostoc sp. UHCC 0302 TaxID=3134896 RepID=UPI00311CC7C7
MLKSKSHQKFLTRHQTYFGLMTVMNNDLNSYSLKLCKGEEGIGSKEQKRENKQESEQLGFKSFLLPAPCSHPEGAAKLIAEVSDANSC